MSTTIKQIVPNSVPVWAVFADERGEPLFVAVVCVGTVANGEGQQFVVGFTVGPHLEPPDHKPNFVGYSSDRNESGQWKDRCLKRRQELAVAARNAKIIVPGGEPELVQ